VVEPERNQSNYSAALDYLFGLQRFGIKLGLTHITALLQHLGNPHQKFPSIHIAGSNGKGSTAAFLSSILQRAGYRVGLYTSPHLVDFSERIQINSLPIAKERVIALTEKIREGVETMARRGELWALLDPSRRPQGFDPSRATITFFEFTTAMAFSYFWEERVEIGVIEVGMGGRLDATNVLDPLASLIASISLEHREYLGKTLWRIAQEKAGIIKTGRPLFTIAHQPRVLKIFEERCRELKAPLYVFGREFRAKRERSGSMVFEGRRCRWPHLSLGLLGRHQIRNAALALAAVEFLQESGWTIQESHVREGLREVRWPGRLELVARKPKILLDGAHNPGAARVLRRALEEEKDFRRRRLFLVIGVMADKDIRRMMGYLVPLANVVILTRPQMERAASLARLREEAHPFQKPMVEIEEVGAAVQYALSQAGEEDLVVISGSLFTVGEARRYLCQTGWLNRSH